MDQAVEASGVTKIYRPSLRFEDLIRLRLHKEPVLALQGVDMVLPSGKVHALIGANGAGKTTLLKVIAGLLRPTTGMIKVFGLDPAKQPLQVKTMVGFGLTEVRSFFLRLTGMENLRFFGVLYGMTTPQARERAIELLDWVGLRDKADKVVWSYSAGMQQRLSIARSLIHDPRLLIFDEVTRGLDLAMRHKTLDLIKSLAADQGRTVILASHDMEAVKYAADLVWVLDKGRIKGKGAFSEMKPLLEQCFAQGAT